MEFTINPSKGHTSIRLGIPFSANSISVSILDWNNINIELIRDNNQREISKFYYLIKNWLLFLTSKNEEIVNDLFMKILNKIDKYNPDKGKFHNFAYTVALNEFSVIKRKKVRKVDICISTDDIGFYYPKQQEEQEYIDYEKELDILLTQKLSKKDKDFVLMYISSSDKKDLKQRVKFSQIKSQLKKSL